MQAGLATTFISSGSWLGRPGRKPDRHPPDPLNLVSFTCSQGTVINQSFCSLASLGPGASVTATLVATPITNPAQSERRFSNTSFLAECATPDPNSSNDTASVRVHIIGNIP